MKFAIAGKSYTVSDIEQLSLWLLLELQSETKDTAQPLDVATVQAMAKTLDELPNDDARKRHPDAPWVLAVTIWASRRLAGEEVTFREAIDFPMSQLSFLPEPGDHKAAKKTAADPTRRRPTASAGAARKRAAKSTVRTSRTASTAG